MTATTSDADIISGGPLSKAQLAGCCFWQKEIASLTTEQASFEATSALSSSAALPLELPDVMSANFCDFLTPHVLILI